MKNKLQLSADPHNKAWSSDTNKFGYQMLLKMGWSEGKGLGANEDGAVDHIKTKKNVENRGVGCDAKTSMNWLQNTHGFADVLSKLNAAYTAPASRPDASSDSSASDDSDSDADSDAGKASPTVQPPKSAQAQPVAKALPKHLIYQKRHKNKNVSAYAKADLAAILGPSKKMVQEEPDEEDSNAEEAQGDQLLRTSTQSIDDYFRARQAISGRDGSDEEDDDADERPSFGGAGLGSRPKASSGAAVGFQYTYQPAEVDDEPEAASSKKEKKQKKKAKQSEEVAAEFAEDAEDADARSAKKSKRRRLAEPEQAAPEAPVEEPEQPAKKSKKSKRAALAVDDSEQAEEAAEEAPKKRKSKKQRAEAEDSETAEAAEAVDEDTSSKKERRKKSKKAAAPEPEPEEAVAAEEEERPKKDKRKKRRTEDSE